MSPNQEAAWRPELADDAPVLCRMGPGFLRRLVAHVLIRVLILGSLPPHVQARAWLFPVWPLAFESGPLPGGGVDRAETGLNGGLKDKANIRYHFEVSSSDPLQRTYRLAYIEEPHKDRLTYVYSDGDRVEKIVQELNGPSGRTPVRELRVTYKRVLGTDRIETAEIVALSGGGLALKVTYTYDEHGNLLTATRSGQNVGGPSLDDLVWSYKYDLTDEADRHQVIEVQDPNRSVTQYQYYRQTDPFPGDATTAIERKAEYVKAVRHFDPREVKTSFVYDQTEAQQNRIKTTVKDPKGFDRLHTLDSNGQELQLDEPLGRQTLSEWDSANVVKIRETDTLGRLTDYGHDGNGNLTSEAVATADLGLVTQGASYHPTFNKLTSKTDRENRTTVFAVDPEHGDTVGVTDAAGNPTSMVYDDYGQLESETDPRNHQTLYQEHDSFGKWRKRIDALGNITTREYDARGRLTKESDAFGRETRCEYDAFDRKTSEVKVAGGQSNDVLAAWTFYPGGQKLTERTGNGARTTYTLDGMNRESASVTYFDRGTVSTSKSYDLNGNLETDRDVAGASRRHTYDDLNRLLGTEILSGPAPGPTGPVASFEYNLVDAKTAEVDVLHAARTDLATDGLYRTKEKLLPELMPDGFPAPVPPPGRQKEQYELDKVGNLKKLTDPNGHVTTFEYDKLNRLIKTVKDPDGQARTTTVRWCNEPGDPPTVSGINKCEEYDEQSGRRVLFEYDELNRETKRTEQGPDGTGGTRTDVTETSYQDSDHQVTTVDPRGKRTVVRLNGLDLEWERVVDEGGVSLTTRTYYDRLGKVSRIQNPNGDWSFFTQDGLGRTWRVRDAAGDVTTTEHYGDGLKKAEKDRRGVRRVFEHDNLRRLTREGLASAPMSGVSWSRTIEYQDAPRRRIERDALERATVFDLDGRGRVVRETDHFGKYVQTTWDGVNKRAVRDKRGNVSLFDYDTTDRLVKTTDPAPFQAQTLETTYLDAQNQVTEKDRRETLKVTQMDAFGRVVSVTRGGVLLEKNTWDGVGNKVLAEDATGKKTSFVYDGANRMTERTDGFEGPNPSVTSYTYDQNGNRLKEIDARSSEAAPSRRFAYDEMDRVTDEWDGANKRTHHGYDGGGNRIATTDAQGRTTTYFYDELSKLTRVVQPLEGGGSATTRYGYDPNRSHIQTTDADGRVVTHEYDELNRLFRTRRDPTGANLTTTTTLFDADGHPERIEEANGEVTVQAWDELGRLKTRTHQAAPSWIPLWGYTTEEHHSYNPNSSLERVEEVDVDAAGAPRLVRVTMRGYDNLDRQTSESFTLQDDTTRSVTTDYWPNGLLKSVTDLAGTTSFTYDGQNREETVTTSAGAATKTYYPDGLVKDATFPNGTKRAYLYDKADRPLSIVTTKGGTLVSSVAYSYDDNGNRLTQVQVNGGAAETTSYTYDTLNRLKTTTYPPDGTHPNGRLVTYGYDSAGNRMSEVVTDPVTQAVLESHTGVFDQANRLMQLIDNLDATQTATLAWDANGNLLSETKAGVTTNYRYDLRDTLGEVERGGQTIARFLGDFDERRVLKIGDPTHAGGQGVQEYLYHGREIVGEVEGGLQAARYEWTNTELVSLFRSDGTRRYYALDGLETVTTLTDEAGNATDRLFTDAWGLPREGTDFGTSGNRFAFTSMRYDTETGFYCTGRCYSPLTGRFIQMDSYTGELVNPQSLHLYAFGWNRPTFWSDRSGHAPGDLWDPRSYDWGVFQEEFGRGATNVVTLGGSGRLEDAYASGRLNANSGSFDVLSEYSAGVINGISFGGADRFVEARVNEQKSIAASTGQALQTFGSGVAAVEELETLGSSEANGWEKATAASSLVAKWAGLAAGAGGAYKSYRVRAAVRGTAVTEPRTQVGRAATAEFENLGGETIGDGLRMVEEPVTARYPSDPVAAPAEAPGTAMVRYDPSFARGQMGIPGEAHVIRTGNMTATEATATRQYAAQVNAYIEQSGRPLMRTPTKGPLRKAASAAARQERLRAARAGTPYQGRAGHVPDTTWTGTPQPPAGWLDMPGFSNDAVGGFAGGVRVGTVVNYFEIE